MSRIHEMNPCGCSHAFTCHRHNNDIAMSEPTRYGPKHITGEELGREWAKEDIAKLSHQLCPPVWDIGPDLIGEIAKLNERIHKHEQDGMEYEKLISQLAGRLNNLEKEFLRVIELYRIAGKA